jgi:hypothetical protein
LGFIVPLLREGAIEEAVEHKISNFLLIVARQKLAGPEVASYSKVEKQRIAQHTPSPLACSEVSL